MTFVPSGCGATALVNQKVPSTVYKSGQVVVSIFLYFVILETPYNHKFTITKSVGYDVSEMTELTLT